MTTLPMCLTVIPCDSVDTRGPTDVLWTHGCTHISPMREDMRVTASVYVVSS